MGAIPTYGSLKKELQLTKEQLFEKDREIAHLTQLLAEICNKRQKAELSKQKQKHSLLQKQTWLQNKLELQYAKLRSSVLQLTVPQPVPRQLWGHATINLVGPSSNKRTASCVSRPIKQTRTDSPPLLKQPDSPETPLKPLQEQRIPSNHPEKTKYSNRSDAAYVTRLSRLISSLEVKYGGAPPPTSRPDQSVVFPEFTDLWTNCLSLDRGSPPILVSPLKTSIQPKHSNNKEWLLPTPQPYLIESIMKPRWGSSSWKKNVTKTNPYYTMPTSIGPPPHQVDEREDYFIEGGWGYKELVEGQSEGASYEEEVMRDCAYCVYNEMGVDCAYCIDDEVMGDLYNEEDLLQFAVDENEAADLPPDTSSDNRNMVGGLEFRHERNEGDFYQLEVRDEDQQSGGNGSVYSDTTADDQAEFDYGHCPDEVSYCSEVPDEEDYGSGDPEQEDLEEISDTTDASFSASAEQLGEDSEGTEASFSDYDAGTEASFSDPDQEGTEASSSDDDGYSDF